MQPFRRWAAFIAWDGLLPLAVSAVPSAVKLLLPRNDMAEVAAMLLVPASAALLRCVIGARQIRRFCDGALPMSRQLALSAAIVLLLLFEVYVAALTFAPDEPADAWAIPICIYALYLATMALAFSPRRAVASCSSPRRGE